MAEPVEEGGATKDAVTGAGAGPAVPPSSCMVVLLEPAAALVTRKELKDPPAGTFRPRAEPRRESAV